MIARDLFDDIGGRAYELEWVDNYDDGLAAMRKGQHDVYLLDYHLGPRDGVELLRAAISFGCRAPCIMLTGQGGREIDLEAMRAGAYDYLVKGTITDLMLERAIRYAISHAKSVDALRDTVRVSSSLLTAVRATAQGIAITDPTDPAQPLVFVNAAYETLTGYDRSSLLGRNPRFLQGEETDVDEVRAMERAIEGAEEFRGDLLNYRPDGSSFWNRIHLVPVFDRHGDLSQYVALCHEVAAPGA